MKKQKTFFSALFLGMLLAWISQVEAKSSYLTQFNTKYGTSGTALNSCAVCHPGGKTSQLNSFAQDFVNQSHQFTTALEQKDSDVDGFSNLAEIQARTFPGDASSKPAGSDTTPPVVTSFSLPSTSSSLTVPITSFVATDNFGVTGYALSESVSAPASGWSGSAPSSYTFPSAGNKTLYAWAKDAAGNVSSPKSAQVSITLPPPPAPSDTTPPVVSSFSIPSASSSLTVPITSFVATDNFGVTGYALSESGSAPASGWSGSAPSSYTFPSAGNKTLYAWAKDAAGNVSSPKSAQVSITLNPTPPPSPEPDPAPGTGAQNWVGRWIRLTIFLKKGHDWSELGLLGEEKKLTTYLHLESWDPEGQILSGLLYLEPQSREENLEKDAPMVLPLDFLVLSSGEKEFWATSEFTGDPSTAFTARFKGKLVKGELKPGILQSKHKEQEGQEADRWFWIKGKLIQESQVPEDILALSMEEKISPVSEKKSLTMNEGGNFD